MAVVAKWITKNGHRIYLRKGGSKNVHDDYYRVEGKGVSDFHGEPLHILDRKQALLVAKANVRSKNFRHDSLKHGFDTAQKQHDKIRVGELQREVFHLTKERTTIHQNNEFAGGSHLSSKQSKALDRLDTINHRLPYLRTEIKNRGGEI
jgi:ABC-type phosphate transport system auxiliary subunit